MPDLKLPVEEPEVIAEPESPMILEGMLEEEKKPIVPNEISILPLRDNVVYPMLIAPLSVTREAGVRLIDDAVGGNNRVIGVITQRDPQPDEPGFDGVYEYGCAVIIRTLVKLPDAVRLIVQGVQRFRIVERLQSEPYMRARIELIDEPTVLEGTEEEIEALRRTVASMFEQAIRLSPGLPDELRSLTQAVNETNVMADLVAAHMHLSVEDKQEILETEDLEGRLKALLQMLVKEVRVLELSSKVQTEVNTELSKNQREYYLREQLKAIQRELGEDDDRDDDLSELRLKIEQANLPPEALKEVKREFDRLKRLNPGSPETSVARTYIDNVIALPWNEATVDNLDLGHA
ncbi:MAG TPA: LON peptidase substrate-binding domain-containing protein, partial [Fimbriimonas sp.]|nr:LON peptidase substrate-binding domain-containing protein [Fimbriimonas sp.]